MRRIFITYEDLYYGQVLDPSKNTISADRHPLQIGPVAVRVAKGGERWVVLNYFSRTITSIPARHTLATGAQEVEASVIDREKLKAYRTKAIEAFLGLFGRFRAGRYGLRLCRWRGGDRLGRCRLEGARRPDLRPIVGRPGGPGHGPCPLGRRLSASAREFAPGEERGRIGRSIGRRRRFCGGRSLRLRGRGNRICRDRGRVRGRLGYGGGRQGPQSTPASAIAAFIAGSPP